MTKLRAITKLRAMTQLGLVLVGTCLGALFTPSCSAPWNECECPTPQPIVQGEFSVGALELSETPPPEFERIVPGKLLVQPDTIVFQYEVDGEAGSASFSVARKYDL
jgi:hypothetical protein